MKFFNSAHLNMLLMMIVFSHYSSFPFILPALETYLKQLSSFKSKINCSCNIYFFLWMVSCTPKEVIFPGTGKTGTKVDAHQLHAELLVFRTWIPVDRTDTSKKEHVEREEKPKPVVRLCYPTLIKSAGWDFQPLAWIKLWDFAFSTSNGLAEKFAQ